jgi:SWI/SNF-related matrix-associated actin-dependent regulator 1 of chromatin subfamily A
MSNNPVIITKLKSNYRIEYNYRKNLSDFIKAFPADQRQVNVDYIQNPDGTGYEKWYRVVSQGYIGKVISFIKDNGIPFKFTNLTKEEVEELRLEFVKRQEALLKALSMKSENIDTSHVDFSFMQIEPYDYQKKAAVFFDTCQGKALLGDQPGVGKTASAMTYAAWKGKKTLVVCPANLRLNWRKEILKFTNEKAFVYKWKPTKKSKKINYSKEESLFHIISYSSLDTYVSIEMSHTCKNVFCGWKERNDKKRYKDKVCPSCGVRGSVNSRATKNITFTEDKEGIKLNPEEYEILIMDEAHYIKNNSADRTKIVKKTLKDIPSRLLLTGTAIKSRPYEFFSLLNFLYPEEWSNAHSFGIKYCAAEKNNFGWDYNGASNLDELFERISPFFLRRLKKDILKQLPAKTYTSIPIELSPTEMREYNKIKKGIIEEHEGDDKNEDNRMNHLTRLQKLKQFTSEIKMKRAFDFIQDITDGDEKVVVFSQYKSVSYKVAEKFGDKAVVFNGDKSADQKEEAVEKFMEDENVKVFSGTIGAAGVGITLTSASISIFIDQPWTPADREQAEDRIHRASSKADKIQIIRLVCQDTIDEYIDELLDQKSSILSKVLDGKEFEQEVEVKDGSIFSDLIKVMYLK